MKKILIGIGLLLSTWSYSQVEVYKSDSLTIGNSIWMEGDSATITFTPVDGRWRFVEIDYSGDVENDFIVILEPVNLAWNCEEYMGLALGKNIYLGMCEEGERLRDKMFFVNMTSTEYETALVFHRLRRIDD